MLILKTRFKHCIQFMSGHRSARDAFFCRPVRLKPLASVSSARCWRLGAKTPWKHGQFNARLVHQSG